MNVTLTVTAGPHAGKEFAFDRHDTFLVGRSKDAHFKLSSDDPYFSRRHFLVEVNPPRVRVLDLNSRNGISVNGNRVKKAELKDGDELKAGHTVFRVNVPQPDPDLQGTLDLPSANPLPAPKPPAPKPPAPKPPAPASEATVQHTVGPQISGYRIDLEIGRGAMGVVYRATREADGQAVAVKVITPVAGVTAKDAQRFLREARIVNALEHKNIIRGFDSGESGGQLYLVMELVTGPDLRDRVKDRGPLDVKTAVRLMLHALDGLAHAHGKGFVHRDIKPANLLLDGPKDRRVVKVADFGLARAFNECGISGLTMQDEIGGTPAFMAPEQVTHYRDAKPAADQYSAAATLYYLLCGQYVLNFETATTAQMVQIVTDDRVPIRKRRADVPAGLEAALMKALSREPGDRHRDVAALKDAIRPFA
jgi:eukaryotic-like serine/threonine-protein kinase